MGSLILNLSSFLNVISSLFPLAIGGCVIIVCFAGGGKTGRTGWVGQVLGGVGRVGWGVKVLHRGVASFCMFLPF